MPDAVAESVDNPRVSRNEVLHVLRGLLMGGADVIPGVSGGTVALILGIYERLVTAISHVDSTFLQLVLKRDFREAGRRIDLKLVIPLGLGIGLGIAILGSVMHTLLEDYRQFTMAAFFGMIGASCYIVARLIGKWSASTFLLIALGAGFALWVVTRKALETPPDGLWYVFVCGVIGICAMILPGISGAFLLLILGKYHEITGIIKDVIKLRITMDAIATVVVFALGCLVGILSFSRLLRWLLAFHWQTTMAVLCGFMLGSLYKIWPFQVDTTPLVEEFKYKRFELIPLSEIAFDGRFAMTLLVMLAAGASVLLLDYCGTRKTNKHIISSDD